LSRTVGSFEERIETCQCLEDHNLRPCQNFQLSSVEGPGAGLPQKADRVGYSLKEMSKIERIKAKGKNKNVMIEKMKQSRA
jgi:hypothetical protein